MGKRDDRGGKRSRGTMTRDVQVSKKLSWLLRHHIVDQGLELRKDGFVNVADVLKLQWFKSNKVTFDEVKAVVKDNEKQRFTMIHASELEVKENESSEEVSDISGDMNDPAHYFIRANQGHTIEVDDEKLLKPISLQDPKLPKVVVHGTKQNTLQVIKASGGLKPMSRNHVHFATGLPEQIAKKLATTERNLSAMAEENAGDLVKSDNGVEELDEAEQPKTLSGMRTNSTALLFLDLERALESGIKFWLSDNGVVLSAGNGDGIVPLEFLDIKTLS